MQKKFEKGDEENESTVSFVKKEQVERSRAEGKMSKISYKDIWYKIDLMRVIPRLFVLYLNYITCELDAFILYVGII